MITSCVNCRTFFWIRWRNELALCEDCRRTALLCEGCAAFVRWPDDPRQLALFPTIVFRRPTVLESPTMEERYWSLRAKASQATRRKYPYC